MERTEEYVREVARHEAAGKSLSEIKSMYLYFVESVHPGTAGIDLAYGDELKNIIRDLEKSTG